MSPVQVRPPLLHCLGCRPGCPAVDAAQLYVFVQLLLREEGALVAKATDVRPKITMACQECKHRNYITKKNRRNDPDRLDLKKFCSNCGRHTDHRETR